MRKVSFSSEHQKQQFKRLKLKNGETVRISLPDPSPELAYQHWTTEFKGVICLGRSEVLDASGSDPDACPLCAVATPGKDQAIGMARRYFAIPVFKYVIDAKKQPIQPVTGEVVVWVFGDDKFSKIVAYAEEYEDLRKHDLRIDCEPNGEQYQKLDIKVAANGAAWCKDQVTAQRVLQQFELERPKSLEAYLGRKFGDATLREIARKSTGRGSIGVSDGDDAVAAEARAQSLLGSLALGDDDIPDGPVGTVDIDSLLT